MGANDLWSIDEVAQHFNVKPATVYNWINSKQVPAPPQERRGKKNINKYTDDWVKQVEKIIWDQPGP